MVSTPVEWAWQALKRDCANLSSSVSSLLCSSSEKMLFIWPKPFAVPFALWGAYRPWDNSKSPSASFLFIKSFLRLLFKSASICLVEETMEGNVKRDVCWRGGGTLSLYLSPCVLFDLISFDSSRPGWIPDGLGLGPWFCLLDFACFWSRFFAQRWMLTGCVTNLLCWTWPVFDSPKFDCKEDVLH